MKSEVLCVKHCSFLKMRSVAMNIVSAHFPLKSSNSARAATKIDYPRYSASAVATDSHQNCIIELTRKTRALGALAGI